MQPVNMITIPQINLRSHYKWLRKTYSKAVATAKIAELTGLNPSSATRYMLPSYDHAREQLEKQMSDARYIQWSTRHFRGSLERYCKECKEDETDLFA